MKGYGLTNKEKAALQKALETMANFGQVFGRGLEKSSVAELLVADKLNLKIVDTVNQPGYDALGEDRFRYQIKYRAENTLNVDVNNFDFDYLILVNLDKNYLPNGMWKLSAKRAEDIFTFRQKYRKYQATQKVVKYNSMVIDLEGGQTTLRSN